MTYARVGQSLHNYGLAVDFIIVSDDGKRALWTEEEKWTRVPAIAKSLVFVWGILNRSGIFRILGCRAVYLREIFKRGLGQVFYQELR